MKVVKLTNLPTRLPINTTVLSILVLNYYHASQVVQAVFATLLVILWLISIVMIVKQEQTDIFE